MKTIQQYAQEIGAHAYHVDLKEKVATFYTMEEMDIDYFHSVMIENEEDYPIQVVNGVPYIIDTVEDKLDYLVMACYIAPLLND